MTALRGINLALKFLLELGAVATFAAWGADVADGAASILLAIGLAGLAIALWGVLAAPRSSRRLPSGARIPFELAFFGLALVALLALGAGAVAAVFGVAVVVNAALLTALGDWEA